MHITSGWAKGARLKVPAGEATRPTAAKVRAAALNMLNTVLPGANVLDLYAGSGGLGLEAISRGAASAVLVEAARPALAALRANIAEFERRAQSQALARPELTVLPATLPAGLAKLSGAFDVILVDPPYKDVAGVVSALLTGLVTLAAPGATLLFESDVSARLSIESAAAPSWVLIKQRAYGETLLTVLEKS